MATVETARGALEVSELGRTLMHEHIFVLSPEYQMNYPGGWDEEARVADAVRRLDELHADGIGTIVDLTAIGQGRDVRRIERLAQMTSLNIVVAAGIYAFDELPRPLNTRGPGSRYGGADPIDEMLMHDIEVGVSGTSVKAGILKCATDRQGVTPGVERVLRATAKARRATGVPISTHTHAGSHRGLDQLDIFDEEGVDPTRVVIGHSGDTQELEYLEEIIARGAYLGMDRFGIDAMLPFEDRVDVVVRMCERGHHTRMVLSHDAACHIDWFDPDALAAAIPNWHYRHISRDVLPALRARGVSEDQIDAMLVENPRAILARGHPY